MIDKEVTELTSKIILAIQHSIKVEKANLHEPLINENDVQSVTKTLKSNFVSSIGKDIQDFEKNLSDYTKAKYVIAMNSGTSALHISLLVNKVRENDEILVPAFTFVASANAIRYCNAIPHFVDSETTNLGVDVKKLTNYLKTNSKLVNGECININTGRRISSILVVHIFGFVGDIRALIKLAKKFKLNIIEDATEALGSFKNSKHAGTFGKCGCLSFNGNKIITTGAGGALLTNDPKLANHARHLSTTAKLKHKYEYDHDQIGYNYRMPAINAALGISQLKKLSQFIIAKKKIRNAYFQNFKKISGLKFVEGSKDIDSNFWLNSIILDDKYMEYKNYIIDELNNKGFACRPAWKLINTLKPYLNNPSMNLSQSLKLQNSIINLPSSPILGF